MGVLLKPNKQKKVQESSKCNVITQVLLSITEFELY